MMSSKPFTDEPACTGPDCEHCARYMQEGWASPIGTLAGEAIRTYIQVVLAGERAPNGFWTKAEGQTRASLLFRFGITHILGIRARSDILSQYSGELVTRLRLYSSVLGRGHSLYRFLDAAFPDLEIMPWELGHAPQGFWTPHGARAALSWFLERQQWSPETCAAELLTRPSEVYAALRACGLSSLEHSIHSTLAALQPGIDVRKKKDAIIQQSRRRRQLQQPLVCPICHRSAKSLIQHRNAAHPEIRLVDYKETVGRTTSLEAPSTREARRAAHTKPSPSLNRRGLRVPGTVWPASTHYAVLEMSESDSRMMVIPSRERPSRETVSGRVAMEKRSYYVTLPKSFTHLDPADVTISVRSNGTIVMRLQSDQAYEALWRWYSMRQRSKSSYHRARYRGVTRWAGLWHAQIGHNGIHSHIGYYDREEDAARAYDAKARELHGDKAHLNLPHDTSPPIGRRTKPAKRSRYRGVHLSRYGKWSATLGFKGTTIYLGTFASEDDAARAHDAKARELHGDTAKLNFPNDPAVQLLPLAKRSRYHGVSRDQITGAWSATITTRGNKITIGPFDTEEEAAQAYDAKARELHGREAHLNFPPPKRVPTSSYRGVSLHTCGKWAAVIAQNKRSIHIGLFLTEEQAARAYDAKAREMLGDQARLNFPDER